MVDGGLVVRYDRWLRAAASCLRWLSIFDVDCVHINLAWAILYCTWDATNNTKH